jgi:sterol desaturase/sphingolipid hydroxylase (fatty acid hydroxylase superfamily)
VVHHADLDFDVTTGLRFHPLEILLSALVKLAAVGIFNHGNVRMPLWLDRRLRWLVVTPDMHRVHHSVIPRETNSNFGFNVPWWDRLLGTYRAQPRAGHAGMTIGLAQLRAEREVDRLPQMLALPFRAEAAIDRLGDGGEPEQDSTR